MSKSKKSESKEPVTPVVQKRKHYFPVEGVSVVASSREEADELLKKAMKEEEDDVHA